MSEQIYFDGRLLLIYLAIKFQGDYDKIVLAIQNDDYPVTYEEAMKAYQALPCKVLTILDYEYPERLKHIWHPPLVLFYYGDISLLDKRCIATVGSRKYSEYGKRCTEKILNQIIQGNVLVSGMARGIDTIAHECAIKNGARTIAVLGSGIDMCYPPENRKLYEKIKKNHLLISEYPYDAPPDSSHFPLRNRIVVGLANAIFVPQINSYQSGTMISINYGADIGKAIIVAPFPPGSNTINNQLINEGAIIADSGPQILAELGWKEQAKKANFVKYISLIFN